MNTAGGWDMAFSALTSELVVPTRERTRSRRYSSFQRRRRLRICSPARLITTSHSGTRPASTSSQVIRSLPGVRDIQVTWSPRARNRAVRAEPTKPLPPPIRMCMAMPPLSFRRGLSRLRERPALTLERPAHRAERRDEAVELAEHVVVRNAVMNELAPLLALDEARVLEHPQM